MALQCSTDGCEAYSVAKGLCRRCYHREYAKTPERRVSRRQYVSHNRSRIRAGDKNRAKNRGPCTSCEKRKAYAKGLCNPCYQKQYYRTTGNSLSTSYEGVVKVAAKGWGCL